MSTRRLTLLVAREDGKLELPAGAVVGRSVLLVAEDAPVDAGQAPTTIHAVPIGEWSGYRTAWGELVTVRITPADILKMVENQTEMGDVPGDYGHALLYEYDAKACGWGKRLEAREDGAWLDVEWTPAAAAAIAAREYRFISPVILYNYTHPETGAEMGTFLHSFALTNTPFFKLDLQPLTAAAPSPAAASATPTPDKESPMWRTLLLAAMTLPEDTTDEALKAAADKHFDEHKKLEASTRQALGLEAGAVLPPDAGAQLVASSSRAGWVRVDEVARIVAEARQGALEDPVVKLGQRIEQLVASGKIQPALAEHFLAWGSAPGQVEACGAALDALPASAGVPLGKQGKDGQGPGTATLSAEERQVAKQLGMSEADFLKSKQARLGQERDA